MSDDQHDQALLTMLTTEHFTLQGARSQTVSEAGARASIYLFTLSSSLVALGFVAQVSAAGEAFRVFALVLLPTLYLLGIFTFIRLVEGSIEDLLYGRAINRIRHYYLEHAGSDGRYFLMTGYDDTRGVLRNMGIGKLSRWQLFFTASAAIAVVNSVVGGSAVGLAVGIAIGPAMGVSVAVGGAFAIASIAGHARLQRIRHEAKEDVEALFPSPGS